MRRAVVDEIIVGGDVLSGLMPSETLRLFLNIDGPLQLTGNGTMGNVEQPQRARTEAVTTYVATPHKYVDIAHVHAYTPAACERGRCPTQSSTCYKARWT